MSNILIVGEERSGKTTLMEKLVEGIIHKKGFITRETSENIILDEKPVERVTYFVRPCINGSFQEEINLGYADFEDNRVVRATQDYSRLDPIVKQLMGKINGDLLFADEITLMDGLASHAPFYELINKFLDAKNNMFIGTISPARELENSLPRAIAANLDSRSLHSSEQDKAVQRIDPKYSDTERIELTPENRVIVYEHVRKLIPSKYFSN